MMELALGMHKPVHATLFVHINMFGINDQSWLPCFSYLLQQNVTCLQLGTAGCAGFLINYQVCCVRQFYKYHSANGNSLQKIEIISDLCYPPPLRIRLFFVPESICLNDWRKAVISSDCTGSQFCCQLYTIYLFLA